MTKIFAIILISLTTLTVKAQYRQSVGPISSGTAAQYLVSPQQVWRFAPQVQSDPQVIRQFTSPWLTSWTGTSPSAKPYWLGSTTTQGFNNGKFGTTYYYDVSGNLRDVRTFIDISGKGKRGLKLLVPLR